jgi:hypothetical protein
MRARVAALGLFALVAFIASVIVLEPAEAQQAGKVHVIAWMSPYPVSPGAIEAMAVVRAGLRERGWTDGKDFTIVRRDAGGDQTRLDALAADVMKLNPDYHPQLWLGGHGRLPSDDSRGGRHGPRESRSGVQLEAISAPRTPAHAPERRAFKGEEVRS